jgi:hypothetical protein
MEYLMSYSWAILVVMVVGVVMWQLGILDVGGTVPVTASGFGGLKPMLPTCTMGDQDLVYSNQAGPGFGCTFVNGEGTDILLHIIKGSINGRFCENAIATNNIPMGGNGWILIGFYTGNETRGGSAGVGVYNVPADSSFIYAITDGGSDTWCENDPLCPCSNLRQGEIYEMDIDIEYEIEIGGVATRKHSIGKIRVSG